MIVLRQAKRRVVHIVRSASYGGVENHVHAILKNLPRTSYELVLISLTNSRIAPKFEALGVEIVSLNDKEESSSRALANMFPLVRVIRRIRPDIVHLHGVRPIFVGSLAARMAGVKTIVSTLHGSHVLMSMAADGHVRPWLLRLSRLMHLTGFWLSNAIILDADGLCKDVKDMFGVIPFCNGARIFRKTTTIHNGIDLTQFTRTKDLRNLRENLGLSEDCMIVGTVCRLDEPKKGLAVLLKAAKQVIDQGFDVHFLVVGEGYSKSDLVSLSRKLGIEFRAHFVGYWENLLEVFRSLDVFVLPSLSEGFPLVNLEAMACGLPVITTQVGGAAEAVIDSVTGLTVPPGDPAKLANAISALLCQPERRRSMGESGLQLVRSRFDEKQMATKIQDLYQKLCN